MFVIVRQFKLKPIFEADFIREWQSLKDIFMKKEGFISASLYKDEDASFIGYIRWCDKEKYDACIAAEKMEISRRMDNIKQFCDSVRQLHKMHLIVD